MFDLNLPHHPKSGPKSPRTIRGRDGLPIRRRRSARPGIEPLEGRTLLSAGALDTTFGGTGMVTTAIGSVASQSEAVAVQSNSDVVVAGWSYISTSKSDEFAITRYNTNGSLDTTFGSGGIAVVPIASYNYGDQAFAVAIQPTDGKILVAGYADVYDKKTDDYYSDWAIVRLNTNGTLDTTFGGVGYVTTRLTPELWLGQNTPGSISLEANGQIVVGGWLGGVSTSGTIQGMALVRYNSNGSLDTTFGTGGKVINTGIIYNNTGATTIAIDGSGRIDFAGQSTVGAGGPVVARYLTNGTLDSSFGIGGVASVPVPPGAAGAAENGLALQTTGNIVVYGLDWNSSGQGSAMLVRLNTNGSLDTSFGASGFYTESRMTTGSAVVVQPADDEIVLVGGGWVNGKVDFNFWVTRVLADGSAYDPSFGTNGLSETNFNNTSGSGPSSVALDSTGRIVVTGPAMHYNGKTYSYYFATARFLGNSSDAHTVLAAITAPSTTAAAATDPVLGALVLNDPAFLDSLTGGKHRRST